MRLSLVSLAGLLIASGCFSDPPRETFGGEDTSTSADDSTGAGSTTASETSAETIDPTTTTTTEAESSGGPSETTDTPGTTDGTSSTGVDTIDPTIDPTEPTPSCPPNRPVLYLNFDGATLMESGVELDDAPAGIVGNPALVGAYGPYTNDDRAMVVQRVADHFDPFGVCVTDELPMAPDFDMIVVTNDTFDDQPNVVGIPNLDCGNARINNVNVVFFSESVTLGAPRRAITISKFAAAFYGLETVTGNEDIMNQFVGETANGATFTDLCQPIVMPTCSPDPDCPGGHQNAASRLAAL